MKVPLDNMVSHLVPISSHQSGKHTLNTDACRVQIDRVPLRKQENDTSQPIGYWSRSCNNGHCVCETTHPECYKVVRTVLLLQACFERTKLTIRTGHDSLTWILNLTNAAARLAQWQLWLSEFDSDMIHRTAIRAKLRTFYGDSTQKPRTTLTSKIALPLLLSTLSRAEVKRSKLHHILYYRMYDDNEHAPGYIMPLVHFCVQGKDPKWYMPQTSEESRGALFHDLTDQQYAASV